MPSATLEFSPESSQLFRLGGADFFAHAGHTAEKDLAKGETLWQAGDDPEAVYLVQKGRVNMVIEGVEGSEAVVHFCTRSQVLCPAAALSGKAFPCTAVAAEPTTVVAVPRSEFLKALNRLPEIARGLMGDMANQVCEAHCRQAQSSAPVKTRLASLLANLNRRYLGRELPFTRQELANMSGTTVESAIRTLSQWEKSGVIESGRGSIHVRKPEELDECALSPDELTLKRA